MGLQALCPLSIMGGGHIHTDYSNIHHTRLCAPQPNPDISGCCAFSWATAGRARCH